MTERGAREVNYTRDPYLGGVWVTWIDPDGCGRDTRCASFARARALGKALLSGEADPRSGQATTEALR